VPYVKCIPANPDILNTVIADKVLTLEEVVSKMNETLHSYDFLIEIDENNKWILEKIKEDDPKTAALLDKTRMNVYMLFFQGYDELAHQLIVKYKELIISAYSYYLLKFSRN